MNTDTIKVLLIEDDPDDVRLIREAVGRGRKGWQFEVSHASRLAAGLESLAAPQVDVILLDLGLPDSAGLDTLTRVITVCPEIPVVVLTGLHDEAVAVEAVRLGAQDYLIKEDVLASSSALPRVMLFAVERKRTADELRRSKQFLQTVFNSTSDAISIINVSDFTIAGANECFLRRYGVSERQAVGMTCHQLTHHRPNPCLPQEEACPLRATLADEKTATVIHTHRIDGVEDRISEVSTSPIRDAGGNIVQVVHVARDITDSWRAEEARRMERENFRNSLEMSPLGVQIVAAGGQSLFVNRALLNMLGYDNLREWNSVPLERRLTPDSAAWVAAIRDKHARGDAVPPYEHELTAVRKDGQLRTLRIHRNEMNWNGRKVAQVVYQDITDRKRSEAALRQSEGAYRQLAESVSDVFFAIDWDMKYTYWNKACEKLTGIPAEAALGKHFLDIFPDNEATRELQRLYLEAMKTGQPQHVTAAYPGGQNLVHEISAYPSPGGVSVFVKDVTERQRAEQNLRRLSQHQETILATVPDIIMEVDANHVYTWANRAGADFFGDDVIGKEASHYFEGTQDTYDTVRPLFDGTGDAIYTESWQRRKDGARRLLAWWCHSLRGDGGEIIGALSAAQDITDRRRAEDLLRESEEHFRKLVATSPDGIATVGSNGLVTFASQRVADLFGYPDASGAVGRSPLEWIAPQDKERARDTLRRVLETNASGRHEYLMVKSDGTQFMGEVSSSALRDDRGASLGLVAIVRDITGRKQAEATLRLSDAVFKSIHEAVFAIDDNAIVTHWNGICESLFGVKACDAIGKRITESISIVEDYPGQNQERIRLLRARGYNREDQVYRTPRGDIWLDVHSQEMESGGKRTGWVTLALDISDRKKAEAERARLEEKAQINSRLAAVGEMAAGIAHEINNPLTGVVGFSKLLLERGGLPEDIKEELGIIADGGQRVADIVKRLLTFARQTKPVRTEASLNDLIDNTVKLRDYVLRTANIEVVTHFDPDLPCLVVDPGQLQQVFLNLIVNAEHAMRQAHGKGTLTITTEKQENQVRIAFQDDGPGISPENMSRLFEPFFTTKQPGEGTGLGLSLSRSIILEHGGDLTFESEPGRGATFTIDLPITEVASPALSDGMSPPAMAGPATTGKGRILVVDDEPGIRELVQRMLTNAGHSVVAVGDAGEAMRSIAVGERYDVIMSDVRMPGMGGMEMYSRIKATVPAMADRVVFMTGDVMGADVAAFLSRNGLPHLTKPFRIAELKDKVDAMMCAGQRPNARPEGGSK